MTKTNTTVCPLCGRQVTLRGSTLPTHGHRISSRGGAGKCPTSGFSVRGLEWIATVCAAFGQLAR